MRERSDGSESFCVKLKFSPEFRPRVFDPSAPQLALIISLTFQTPPSVKQDHGLKKTSFFLLLLSFDPKEMTDESDAAQSQIVASGKDGKSSLKGMGSCRKLQAGYPAGEPITVIKVETCAHPICSTSVVPAGVV